MATLVMSDYLGAKIIDILGLPKHTTEFKMNFEAGSITTIDCKFMVEETFKHEDILAELAKYRLVKIDDKAADRRKKRRMDSED